MTIRSTYEDGEGYENPFLAMLEHGREWAEVGMGVEDMTAAAEQLGGLALGRNAPRNLEGFANELITQQAQAQQGEQ